MRTREESDSKSQKLEKDFKCKLALAQKAVQTCTTAATEAAPQRCSGNSSDKTSLQRSAELARKFDTFCTMRKP
eukprot:1528912-Amphidinium_carterae.1